jgi:HK97 family phage major capsid protein
MSDIIEVKNLIEAQGRAWEEHKKTNDELLKAKADGKAVAELDQKLANISTDLDKIAELKSEFDAVVEKLQRTGGGEGKEKIELDAEVKQFNLQLRADLQGKGRAFEPIGVDEYVHYKSGFFKLARNGNVESLSADERKAMIAGSDPDGGYLLPPSTVGRMVTKLYDQSVMRQLATVQTISTQALEGIVDNNEADAGWVTEIGARSDTATPQVGKYRIEAHELYAMPKASQTLIDDSAVNIEGWLADKVADKFARVEGLAFWRGTGTGQPRGLATYTTAATADSSRAWGQFEHVKSGAAGDFHTTQFDPVVDLIGAMKEHFLPNASFCMTRGVRTKARKLKESTTNRYLWEPGMQAGSPDRLMGYPVRTDEYMPALTTGSLSLAFGDFAQAYTIVDRIGIRTLRDPYTAKPYIVFYSTKRTGGGAVNFEAVKFILFNS